MEENNSSQDQVESNKKANLNTHIPQDVYEMLSDASYERGGSNRHMGEIVAEALREYLGESAEQTRKINEIHQVLCEGDSTPTSTSGTHTGSSEDSEELKDIRAIVEEGEPLNPSEYDLSVCKGRNSVDVVDAGVCVLKWKKENQGQDAVTKSLVKTVFEREFEYSPNAARDKAKQVLQQLTPSIANSSKEWTKKAVQDDIENNLHSKNEGSSRIVKKEWRYKKNKTAEDYLRVDFEIPEEDIWYVDEEDAEQAKEELSNQLVDAIESEGNSQVRQRLLRFNDFLADNSGDA
ncbi:hypothetical protein [Halopiger thermotolerans]